MSLMARIAVGGSVALSRSIVALRAGSAAFGRHVRTSAGSHISPRPSRNLRVVDAQVELERSGWIECRDERKHRNALVTKIADMFGSAARCGAIVDSDERRGNLARLIDGDYGQPAGERGLDTWIVLRRRVDKEAVDDRLTDHARGLVAVARVWDQKETRWGLLHPEGHTAKERR